MKNENCLKKLWELPEKKLWEVPKNVWELSKKSCRNCYKKVVGNI